MTYKKPVLPTKGKSKEEIFAKMRELKKEDAKWEDAKVFSLIFQGNEEMYEVIKEAYNMFFSENGLNPSAFPSLKTFENEVVSMMCHHLGGGDEAAGSLTSGGTESILMAMKCAREWAKIHKPHVKNPTILLPLTAHPAFDKAAHYFGLDIIKVPYRADYRLDLNKMRELYTDDVIIVVGSAPQYPQGVIDPIKEIGEFALEKNILFHVDACVGGVVLPFFKKMGIDVADMDFSVPGVTSISADIHKYGYAAKGASVVVYKNKELRLHQFFVTTDWPGGMYASPAVTGTRPGGAIAAAWAIMNYMGEDRYKDIFGTIKNTVDEFVRRIEATDGVELAVKPDMFVCCITSKKYDIYEIGDAMSARGWHMDRQQNPNGLHLTITWAHHKIIDQFFSDLQESIKEAAGFAKKMSGMKTSMAKGFLKAMPKKMVSKIVEKEGKSFSKQVDNDGPKKTAAMYGMMAAIPEGDLDKVVLNVLDGLFTPSEVKPEAEKKTQQKVEPSRRSPEPQL